MRITLIILSVLCGHASFAQDMAQARPDEGIERAFREGERARSKGDHAAAIALYTEVLRQDRDHLNAYLQRGFCHNMLKAYEAAVQDYSAVIGRKSDHIWAYTSRGSAYNKLQRYDLALYDFDTVIGLDPKNEEAYNNRGWTRKALGDNDGACQDWKSSKKLGNAEARIILENNRCK